MKDIDRNFFYRPWHQPIKETLSHMLEESRLPHGLLFMGPRFIGKTHFARSFAQRLLCLSENFSKKDDAFADPCGNCKSCLLFNAETHPDYHEVICAEGKQSIPVSDVRMLHATLVQKSQLSGNKVCVVNSADKFNENSANAILKLLEEPPEQTYFLLIAHQVQKILPTVKSRCTQVRFGMPEAGSIEPFLKQFFSRSENEHVDEAKISEAIIRSGGFPEKALAYLSLNQSVDYEEVDNKAISSFLSKKSSVAETIAILVDSELGEFVEQFQRQLHRMSVVKCEGVNDPQNSASANMSEKCLEKMQMRLYEARGALHFNPNRALFLESLLNDCEKIVESVNSNG